jgi:serine/threonine protein kinase
MTKEIAIDEVAHLTRLDHAHIVRVIGTYSMGENLSILMYPVAEWNLETFLSNLHPGWDRAWKKYELVHFFGCLTNAVAYIHGRLTKHMDIKPQNILVREHRQEFSTRCKVYITDFGIARSYTSLDVSETEGPTMFTRRYAAPEVVDGQKRGLPADIFSLGCVFLEMAAALFLHSDQRSNHKPLQTLKDKLALNEYGDTSYQANISSCRLFTEMELHENKTVIYGLADIGLIIMQMLDENPAKRPSASELIDLEVLQSGDCCSTGSEPLEVAREATDGTVNPKDSTPITPRRPRLRPPKDLTAMKGPKPRGTPDVPPQNSKPETLKPETPPWFD